MIRSSYALCAVSALSLAFGCSQEQTAAHSGAVSETPVFYERFALGDPTTDQAAGAPGAHSTLIGTLTDDADVRDEDFRTNIAAKALGAGAALYAVFNQCYSGGFLDDLARLGGTQSVMSAARHTETASYGYEAPSGVDLDSTDTFIRAMGDGTKSAEHVAREAVALNPFGPNPNAPRIDEEEGSEHAQYLSMNGGDHLRLKDMAAGGIAVLWAGQPAARDGAQMASMIERLVAMGYQRSHVYMLYAGGEADAEHPVVSMHMQREDDSVNLMAATRANLAMVFNQAFAKEVTAPTSVFLYVGDHGGLNEASEAKKGFPGHDPLVTPELKR